MQKPMMSLALSLAMAKAGKAQKGWMRLVQASPQEMAMPVNPGATPRAAPAVNMYGAKKEKYKNAFWKTLKINELQKRSKKWKVQFLLIRYNFAIIFEGDWYNFGATNYNYRRRGWEKPLGNGWKNAENIIKTKDLDHFREATEMVPETPIKRLWNTPRRPAGTPLRQAVFFCLFFEQNAELERN